jgi:hypothetical protein
MATPLLVDEATFTSAVATAHATRVLRYVLWHYEQPLTAAEVDDAEDVLWQWNRVTAAPTQRELNRSIDKVERWGDRYTWLITEEHHDAAGNAYFTDGTPLETHWQPAGPALLRVAANSQHWIPVSRLIGWNCTAAVAISDTAQPEDWEQPDSALFTSEDTVFVHFTGLRGPYPANRNGGHSTADNKRLAQRRISERLSAFLGGRPTASRAEVLTAVLRYIQRNGCLSGYRQTVTPDATLTSLLDGHAAPFPLHELSRRLRHHTGDIVGPTLNE